MGLKTAFKQTMKDFIKWVVEDRDDPAKEAYSNKISSMGVSMTKSSSGSSSALDDSNGLSLTVFSATGGKIVKVHSYDKRLDRINSSLHIVTEQEDLGEELAQIITRENLSR